MDIARPESVKKSRTRRRCLYAGAGLLGAALTTAGLSRLEPALPAVDRAQVWIDTVRQGEMLREVRGNGSLVPEEILWIPTLVQGRVDRILVLPGAAVKAETVLVELTNPEAEQAAFDAEWQLKAAEAELTNLCAQLKTQRLDQRAAVATARTACENARLDAAANEELAADGLVPQLILKQSRARAAQTAELLAIEEERLEIAAEAAQAQRAMQASKVQQLRAQLQLKRRLLESLKIRAGIDGVLQRLGDEAPLRVGQRLPAGASIARVANPARLKAEIKVYETQAKDIQLGQPAFVDTRNGVIPGRVIRIDPAVDNGTVTLDVALEGPLPKGARPDLSVEGTVELERLQNVLYVGKPVQGSSQGKVGLFKLARNGKEAVQVPVQLGRASVGTIEILEGLRAGDRVILSDMSRWEMHDRVRLN